MIRLMNIIREENNQRDAAMVSGVADIVSKVKDKDNRKEIAQQMMSKFDLEDVGYDKESFLKLSKVEGLNEEGTPEGLEFTEFARKRLEGAGKIAADAKAKGGASILTYHHFVVKLPYYKEAAEGKFNPETAKQKLQTALDELCEVGSDMEQIHFQELVGLVEVLGELLINKR